MKLAILSLPKIERDKLMQTLLADKAKGDVGFIRACGLDPEVFDRQFLTVGISRDLRSTSVSLHKNEMEMLWSMNQLEALIESGSREPFHVQKAGTFDGDMDAARETAAKVMDEARREAGYRGETREDLKKWLIETGRLPANCDDLMEPLIEKPKTRGRKENTGAILTPDANELRTVLGEVSEALKDDDAVGIVVYIDPIDYFIAKNDSGLPGKVAVAVGQGSQVLGALYLKRKFDGMSGRLQPFQKHKNDESAKKRLQGVLDKMLTDGAQTEGERRPVRLEKLEKELRDQATRFENDREAKEVALDQPHHLFFFSAVDPDRVTRFFDILNEGDGFSLAEAAVSAPRLGGCTETVYESPGGGTHHVHRLYGKFRTDSSLRAMQDFAKHSGLTEVTEIAETLNLREAQPTWELIFEKLGCLTIATNPKPLLDHGIAGEHTAMDAVRDRRILVVSHERVIAEFICQLLLREGYETRMECSSVDAIRMAGEFGPQLLIIDPVMPVVMGFDAAKRIADETKCKVLLISAGALDADFAGILNDLQNQGCDCAAFSLPFEKEDLLEQVRLRIGPVVKAVGADSLVSDTRPADELIAELNAAHNVDSQCLIELLPERLPLSFEAIESARLDVFFALGIVNPAGPTFSFVAAVGEGEEGKVLPVVNVMLNPFSQSVEEVARFTVGARWKPVNDLESLFQLGFGSCPSLVLLSAEIPEQSRISFTTKALEAFGQGVVVVHELVSSHFGDPWTRVSAEMEGARRRTTSALTQAEASKQLAQLLLQPKHMWPELRALLFAWSGSIHKTGIPKQLAAEAFSKERFEKFLLERVCPTLWLPPEPNQEPPVGHLEPPSQRESQGGEKVALTSQEERITGDVGPQLLAFIYEQMKIDPEWSVREERSLTWWGHRLAQRIWAETVIIEGGDEIVRVHAETDVLRNVNTEAHATQSLSILNRNASLSAYVWNPETKKISLRSSAYFHSQNFPWLSVFFLSSVSLQAAEAHLQPDALAKLVGGEVDESAHPTNGSREKQDEMLDVIPLLYAPCGKNPSRFTTEDFHAAIELNPKPWLMANEGENGLTAEFPFPGCMPPTALLTLDNEIRHPLLGSGLFILLRLPLNLRGANVESLASQLNLAELRNPIRTHFMGSWCVDSDRNVSLLQLGLLLFGEPLPVGVLEQRGKEILSFCSFIPSVCYRPGLLENVVYSIGLRTMWANQYLASIEGVPGEFGPRDSEAFQEQSNQHLSLIQEVFNRARRQIKRKPN